MPRLHAPGMVICGDGGGMVNVPKLKGIHYAIRSGMLAAETIYRAAQGRLDATSPPTSTAVHDSEIGKDLYESRNMKQPFAQGPDRRRRDHQRDGRHEGAAARRPLADAPRRRPAAAADRPPQALSRSPTASTRSTSSRASSRPATRRATTRRATSGSSSASRASWRRRGRGCAPPASTRCPRTRRTDAEHVDLIVNPSNCVQCGAITAKGGRLTPPEGGDGPVYQVT